MSLRRLSKIYLGFKRRSRRKKKKKTQAAETFLGRCVWRKSRETNGGIIRVRLRGISVRYDRHCAGIAQLQQRLYVSLRLLFLAGL